MKGLGTIAVLHRLAKGVVGALVHLLPLIQAPPQVILAHVVGVPAAAVVAGAAVAVVVVAVPHVAAIEGRSQ